MMPVDASAGSTTYPADTAAIGNGDCQPGEECVIFVNRNLSFEPEDNGSVTITFAAGGEEAAPGEQETTPTSAGGQAAELPETGSTSLPILALAGGLLAL